MLVRKIDLEESKQLQLGILDAFDEFCREHSLRYMLAYGTLLGAVRHSGFIPWDDDIDLTMPIEDYRKMAAILNGEGNGGVIAGRFRVAGMGVESPVPYHQTFAKIYDLKTTAEVSSLRSDLGFEEGIFIDIFPVAGLPEGREQQDEVIRKLRYANSMLYWATRNVTAGDFTPKHPRTSLYNFIDWVASHRKPFQEWMDEYYGIFRQLPDVEGADVAVELKICLCTGLDKYRDNPWLPVAMMDFEGCKRPVPAGYDAILTRDYGDYMQLPPEDMRHPTHDQDYFIED